MVMPKDIARSYPKRGLTADLGFQEAPFLCGEGSIKLNGSNQYLNAELDAALGDSFSVVGWAKRMAGVNSLDYILNAGSPSGTGNAISVSITNANPGYLYFFDNLTSVNTTGKVEFGEWFHFALTVAPGAGNVKLYKNGIDGTPSNSVAVNISDVTLNIGRYLGDSHYFEGSLFDLRIYDETLTQSQIRELLANPNQTIPTGLTSSDLIHRYLFETNANDTGATGNNLTANNSPEFTLEKARVPRGRDLVRDASYSLSFLGSAVQFDGSADYLQADNYTKGSSTATTVSFWMNSDLDLSSAKTICNNQGGGAGVVDQFIVRSFSGSLDVQFHDSTQRSVNLATTTSGFAKGKWNHIVFSINASSTPFTCKAFFNGHKQTTIGSGGYTVGTGLNIGARSNSFHFDGMISNFKIFDTELTDAQCMELLHFPEKVLPTGVSASNLRRHYPLNDFNDTGGLGGRYFQDLGSDEKHAEDKGSSLMSFGQPSPCPQTGLQETAAKLYWKDATGQKLSTTLSAFDSDFTIAFWWFRASSANADVWLEVNTPGLYQLYYDLTQIVYYSSTSGVVYTGVSCPEGEWSHIAITSAGIFKNGVKHTPAFTLDWLGTEFRIFGRHSASLPCSGCCPNMGVWSDDLSTAEILELYNQGPDYDPRNDTGNYASSATLTNLWFMDDTDTVLDRVGSNNLTVIGDPPMQLFTESTSGTSIVGEFNLKRRGASVLNMTPIATTSNQYSLSEPSSSFYPSFANGGSFSCFFRLLKRGEYSTFFINDAYGTGNQHRHAAYVHPSNYVLIELGDGDSDRANPNTTGTISDSDWHHFAYTVDYDGATTTIKLYLDGVLDSTSTATTLSGVPNPSSLRFGDYVTSGSNEANGPLACLKFYQVTLSANEIKQIYNSDLRLIKGLDNE